MYPFPDLNALRAYIISTFTANGVRDITGPELQDALKGLIDLCPPILSQSLTVQLGAGQTLGGVSTGQNFAQGTLIEDVLRALLIKVVHPTYVPPTIALSSNLSVLNYEIGTNISPTLTTVFAQNDAGSLIVLSLKKNGVQIATATPYTDNNVVLDNNPVTYQATGTYGQGACKNNNLGQQDCVGRITAGSVNSNSIVYNGYRKVFWGTPLINLATSADVRSALTGSSLNPQNGTQFSISIPAGSLRVAFAYPATLQDVTSVKYREFLNAEVKGNFTQTTINVEGASGFTAVPYKVYVYEPVEPFPQSATYDVTI